MKHGKKDSSDLAASIRLLTRDIVRIKSQAKALGWFTNDRKLLECKGCDLIEDGDWRKLRIPLKNLVSRAGFEPATR